ncbi:hypothetical protein FACS189451_01350 [Bacteroidia bacterium]|nr:hypothetical protein FACS189446_1940 [Bacteroidia bacterium]GHT60743.1 hypothetical protein FACS189451_01350 [Bacteroidia bacterium]
MNMETTTWQDFAPVDEAVRGVEFDENGKPVGISAEEWFDLLDRKLITHFGEEYRLLANERRTRWNQKSDWNFGML